MTLVSSTIRWITFTPTGIRAGHRRFGSAADPRLLVGAAPHVVTRAGGGVAFDWPHTTAVPYPRMPAKIVPIFICRAMRKLGGWQHLRQGRYDRRVAAVLRDNG